MFSGTRAREEQAIVEKTFPDLSGRNFNSLRQVNLYGVFARMIIKAKKGQLLSREILDKVKELNALVQQITAKDEKGQAITVTLYLQYLVKVVHPNGSATVDQCRTFPLADSASSITLRNGVKRTLTEIVNAL